MFGLFSKPLLNLSLSLYVQSGIKYVLTSGDVLVSTLASLEDQGMYALSANYGGLIARMVFRPIEDSTRNLFAKLCAPPTAKEAVETSDKKRTTPSASLNQAATILRDILRVYTIVSLIAFAIGPTAAPLLLRLIAGSRWSDSGAGEVLGTYCYCIPLLAINGVSEAFVAATASTKDLHWQSVWMGAFSAGFIASAYVFLRVLDLGAKGLVWANCVNMGLRIVFNLNFVMGFFGRNDVVSELADIAICGRTLIRHRLSKQRIYCQICMLSLLQLWSQACYPERALGWRRTAYWGSLFALVASEAPLRCLCESATHDRSQSSANVHCRAVTERHFLMDCIRRLRA